MCRKDPVGSRFGGGGRGSYSFPAASRLQERSGSQQTQDGYRFSKDTASKPADSGGYYILGREIGPVASRLRGIIDSQ